MHGHRMAFAIRNKTAKIIDTLYIVISRAETNIRFARIVTRLYNYSNTLKVFEYTTINFSVVILAYLGNIYIFKATLVIQ